MPNTFTMTRLTIGLMITAVSKKDRFINQVQDFVPKVMLLNVVIAFFLNLVVCEKDVRSQNEICLIWFSK